MSRSLGPLKRYGAVRDIGEEWELKDHRFVALPKGKLTNKLEAQVKEKEAEAEQLTKKLHYLETTYKNSREHLEKMLKSQGA